jgi:hypothetical protein
MYEYLEEPQTHIFYSWIVGVREARGRWEDNICTESKSRIFCKKILYLLSAVLAVTSGSRIHEGTISLRRFLGIILRVFRLEVSIYNGNITNQFQTTFARGEGVKSAVEATVKSKEENQRLTMELDLQSLFGLHVHSCGHWLRPRPATPPPPPPLHLGPYTRALLVSQYKRYLFVTPWVIL